MLANPYFGTIVSESGRAIVAYHSVLVFNVLGVSEFGADEIQNGFDAELEQPIIDLKETYQNLTARNALESYHDAQQALDMALNLFNAGYLPLKQRSMAETLFWAISSKLRKIVQQMETQNVDVSTTVAVHSLRGGVGCTSIAVNLAIAYYQLWQRRTLLVDAVLTAGQVATMLDSTPRVTWEHFVGIPHDAIEDDDLETLATQHKSGIYYVASPKSPLAVDAFAEDFWRMVFNQFKQHNEFLVVDMAHDLSDMTIQVLNTANWVLLILAPEIGSLRAASSALEIYDKLGVPPERIKMVLNRTSPTGIQKEKLEKVLERPFDFVLPYEPVEVRRALDFGVPFILENPELPISMQLENIAYLLSDDLFKNLPPALPSATWKRVTKRLSVEK